MIERALPKEKDSTNWVTIEHPGYLGSKKDQKYKEWDQKYGPGNWRIAWESEGGEVWDYNDVFWRVYVSGYVSYFLKHKKEAKYLTENFAYAYDKELIDKKDAFDPNYFYEKPGHANQFHNVALNIALEYFLILPFQGEKPIQIREGKPGTPVEGWPAGWRWSPSQIPVTRADIMPTTDINGWWKRGSIEDFYQQAKVLQVKG